MPMLALNIENSVQVQILSRSALSISECVLSVSVYFCGVFVI